MRKISSLALLLALATVACLGSDFADSIEGEWQLTSGTVDGEDIPIIDSHPITIVFEGEQVSGTASCNGYGGTYQLSGSSISMSELASTEMACFPEETMDAESLFLGGLLRVSTVTLDETLTLRGDGVSMTFEPAS